MPDVETPATLYALLDREGYTGLLGLLLEQCDRDREELPESQQWLELRDALSRAYCAAQALEG
jgi:hypothetical protein